jgi:hypothetical protein
MTKNIVTSNAEAVQNADALLDACAALRRELVAYERALRRMRAQVLKGEPNPAPEVVQGLVAARRRFNECVDELERCRRRWRSTYFQLQVNSGKSLGAIAREWGLSRQLVSRLMNGDAGTESSTSRRSRRNPAEPLLAEPTDTRRSVALTT